MVEQRSEQWYLDRLGCVTGSRFGDVIAVGRNGQPLKSRETVITEVTLELLTGRPGPMWSSKATLWGIEHEPEARMAYEIHTGSVCEEVGFIKHADFDQVGCSPDSLIGLDGGMEIKCPYTTAVHLQTLLNGMPEEHMPQCQGGMWCANRQFWDFVSYHPDFPPGMQLYVQRIERDQKFIDAMQESVLEALAVINRNVITLIEKYKVQQ